MIEDIKIKQNYDWVYYGGGIQRWEATNWTVLVLKNGEWSEVYVQHVNPFPPEDEKNGN
jgi:hypothetical protein